MELNQRTPEVVSDYHNYEALRVARYIEVIEALES